MPWAAKRDIVRARWIIPLTIPVLAVVFGVWGQVKEKLSVVALGWSALLAIWALGLLIALVVQGVRRRPLSPLLVALGVSALGGFLAIELVLGTPTWVRDRARPAIDALDQFYLESGHYPTVGSLDGDFPRPLRATLEASGRCIYKPRGAGYHLACLSIPFSKCGYDGATRTWTGWE
jgi:hypothetical protein